MFIIIIVIIIIIIIIIEFDIQLLCIMQYTVPALWIALCILGKPWLQIVRNKGPKNCMYCSF